MVSIITCAITLSFLVVLTLKRWFAPKAKRQPLITTALCIVAIPAIIILSRIFLTITIHALYEIVYPSVRGLCTYWVQATLWPPFCAILSGIIFLFSRPRKIDRGF